MHRPAVRSIPILLALLATTATLAATRAADPPRPTVPAGSGGEVSGTTAGRSDETDASQRRQLREKSRDRELAERLQRRGVRCEFDHKHPEFPIVAAVLWSKENVAENIAELAKVATLRSLGVRFSGNPPPGSVLAPLARHTKLAVLQIDVHDIDETWLEHVGEIAHLEELRLSWTVVTPGGLAHLKALKGLKALSIEYPTVLRGLSDCDDAGRCLGDDDLAFLGDCRNLEELRIEHQTRIGDEGLRHLRNATKLRILELPESEIRGPGLRHLPTSVRLESLALGRIDFHSLPVELLPRLKTLRCWLDETDGRHADVLETIGRCADLTVLELHSLQAGDDELRRLSKLVRLQELTLEGPWSGPARFTGAGLAPLAGRADLKTLNLGHSHVSGVGAAFAKGFPNLAWLVLHHTELGDDDFVHLGGLSKLETLFADETLLGDVALNRLAAIESLKTVSLRNTHATKAGMEQVRKLRPDLRIVAENAYDGPPGSMQPLVTIPGQPKGRDLLDGILHVEMSADGAWLAILPPDDPPTLRHIDSGRETPLPETTYAVEFSPDGKRVGIGGPKDFHVRDLATGKDVQTFATDHEVVRLAWLGSDHVVAILALPEKDPDRIEVRQVPTGKKVFEWASDAAGSLRVESATTNLRFVVQRVLETRTDLFIFDAESGKRIATWRVGADGDEPFSQHLDAIAPDGSWVTVQSFDGKTVTKYAADTGRVLGTTERDVLAGKLSRDGTVRLAESNGRPTVFDAKTGKPLATVFGHVQSSRAESLSDDRRRLLTSGSTPTRDWEWKVWDLTPQIAPGKK